MRSWRADATHRLSAWFVPPVDGEYSFHGRSSGSAELWWSGSARPAEERLLFEIQQDVAACVRGTCSVPLGAGWQSEPQAEPISLLKGHRYWLSLICYEPGAGDCALGVRIHAPASRVSRDALGGVPPSQRLVLVRTEKMVELSIANGCSRRAWVSWNATEAELSGALLRLFEHAGGVLVTQEAASRDQRTYLIEWARHGALPLLQAASHELRWAASHVVKGGVDVLPVAGRMLVAPSKTPRVSVRVRGATTALCDSTPWHERNAGCWLRYHQSGVDAGLSTVRSFYAMGMTLERCDAHCSGLGHAFFAVSADSGVTTECGCLPTIDDESISQVPTMCDAPCPGAREQLCGGRDVHRGMRFATIYKSSYDPIGGLQRRRACDISFFTPRVRTTGIFPTRGVAGTTIHVLLAGLPTEETSRWDARLRACGSACGLPRVLVCGIECAAVSRSDNEAFLLEWANSSWLESEPWADEVPMGVYDATPLLCAAPACAAGKVEVEVITRLDGILAPVSWLAGLRVDSVTRGGSSTLEDIALAVTGGAELDVLGTGFDAAALGRNIVSIGQMGCLVLDASPNRLRCRTQATNASAAGAAATLVVSILDDHGALRANATLPDDSTQALSFLPLEATPSVSGFDQPWMATGSAAGGQELCVLGVRLDEVARVLLGQAPCTNVTATSDGTSLCCTTSVAGEVGAVPIVALTNSSGAALVGAGVEYEYVEAPTVTAVSPIQGYAGVVATIHGTGLCGAGGSNGTVCDDPLPEVRVGGALCEIVAAYANAVLFVVPAGAPSEQVCDYSWCPNGELVTVHVPRVGAALAAPPQETDADVPIFQMSDDGGRLVVPSRTAGAVRFRYVPAVVAVEPKVVSLAGGVDLTIHGSGFSHLSALRVSLLSREALADLDRPLGPARNSWANTASTRALNLTCGSPAFGGAEAIERRPPSWRPASYRSIVCRAPPLYATEEEYQLGQREDRILFIHVEWRRRPRCTGCEPWSEGAACAVPGGCAVEYTAARTPVIDIVRPQEGGAGTAITILGSGFGPTAADNSVSLGDQPCAVVSAARDRIVCTAPPNRASGPEAFCSPPPSPLPWRALCR